MIFGAYDYEAAAAVLDHALHALKPGATVLVVGATCRHARKVVRELGVRAGTPIKEGADVTETAVYGRRVVGMPIGDGSKPRGLRPDATLFFDPLAIPRELAERVVMAHCPTRSPCRPDRGGDRTP